MNNNLAEKILLKYVPVYDANLSLASGHTLTEEEIAGGYEFCKKLQEAWEKSSEVLAYYESLGFRLPAPLPAYVAHPRGTFTPFSDPLTIHIIPDLDDALATLVHEYCHSIFLSPENDTLADTIWKPVEAAFANEEFMTQDHIVINKLTEAGLTHIWGKEKTDAVLAKERSLPGLKRAWEIWDESGITAENPIEAILELAKQA